MFCLFNPPGLPRGYDIVEDFHVSRVMKVETTPSAPRGCITLIAKEGGFRNINVADITEVVGTLGAIQPRDTNHEVAKTKRQMRREVLRSRRKARRQARAS